MAINLRSISYSLQNKLRVAAISDHQTLEQFCIKLLANGVDGHEVTLKADKFIYLMKRAEDGAHKIGLSWNPSIRRGQVGRGISLVWCEQSEWADSIEYALHAHFKDKNIKGEWFDLNALDIDWIKGLEMFHPSTPDGFKSFSVSCKCHPPKFTKGWKDWSWTPMTRKNSLSNTMLTHAERDGIMQGIVDKANAKLAQQLEATRSEREVCLR